MRLTTRTFLSLLVLTSFLLVGLALPPGTRASLAALSLGSGASPRWC
jgi:hypothetical protein